MTLVKQGVKYVIIDSATFGSKHVCGAIFISYTWVPPWSKKPRIKVKIPKDYYIFVYCTWPNEEDSARVADFFIKKGYRAFAIKQGLKGMKKAGFPICPGRLTEKGIVYMK